MAVIEASEERCHSFGTAAYLEPFLSVTRSCHGTQDYHQASFG